MIWVIGLLVLLGLASSGRTAGSGDVSVPSSPDRAAIEMVGREIGLSDAWIVWLIWVAKGESDWTITAHNDSPGESAKAGEAFDRLVAEGRWPCPKIRSDYAIGSGGWYGQLAPYTVLFFHELGGAQCSVQAVWTNPTSATRVHLRQVEGLIKGWLNKLPPGKRTFLHLRALYGSPARINEPDEIDNPERRQKYGATLVSAGIDPSFLDTIVPPLEFNP